MASVYLPIATTAGASAVGSPDTGKVPTGTGVDVPTPMVNTASGASATGTSTKVMVVMQPALLLGSVVPVTSGDEAATDGGVVSGMVDGQATFLQGSSKVIIEGRGVVVVGHATGHNGAAPNCTGNVVSASNVTVNASL